MPTILTRAGKAAALSHNELDANFARTVTAVTDTYQVLVADNRSLIECNKATPFTVTMVAVASAAAEDTGDFETAFFNIGAGTVSIDGSGSETINGSTDAITLEQYEGVVLKLNAADGGWNKIAETFNGVIRAYNATAAGDLAAVGYTSTGGLVLTGQGSNYDVQLKNDAGNVALGVPTGTQDLEALGNFTATAGEIRSGVGDTTSGIFQAFGAGTGVGVGGQYILQTSADYDTVVNAYRVRAFQDDFEIVRDSTAIMTFDQNGEQWEFYTGTTPDLALTINSSQDAAFEGSISIEGGITQNGDADPTAQSTMTLGKAKSTGNVGVEMGSSRTGDGIAFIDMHSSDVGTTAYSNYTLRIARNGGDNGTAQIDHRGTGNFLISTNEAANLILQTDSTTALTLDSSQNASFAGQVAMEGNLIQNGDGDPTAQSSTLLGQAKSTGTVAVELGSSRTDDGIALIDFHSDAVTSNYAFRIIRNAGANGTSKIDHKGTGNFLLSTAGAADLILQTNATTALTVDGSTQGVSMSGNASVIGGTLNVGVGDTTGGILQLFGNTTGSNEGGEARIYLAADHDGTFNYWFIDAFQDDLRFARDGNAAALTIDASDDATFAGDVTIDGTTDSTSGTTGSIQTDGGIGAVKDIVTDATFKPLGDTSTGDAAAVGYHVSEGLILTGDGSVTDVVLKNQSDQAALWVTSATTDVVVASDLTIQTGGELVYTDHPVTYVVKQTDESVSSATTGTTLQDDDELTFTVDADSVYKTTVFLAVYSASVTPKIKVSFSEPASAGFIVQGTMASTGSGGTSETFTLTNTISDLEDDSGTWTSGSSSVVLDINSAAATFYVHMDMTVRTGSNSGSITLQWAQNVSNATNVTVLAGSYLKAEKIGTYP